MSVNILRTLAMIEQVGVVLNNGFTIAVIVLLLGGISLFRRRYQFFDSAAHTESYASRLGYYREETIIILGTALMLILVGILHQIWSA